MNDEIWIQLTFDLVKSERALHNQDVTCEVVLKDLTTRISELPDILHWRRSSGNDGKDDCGS